MATVYKVRMMEWKDVFVKANDETQLMKWMRRTRLEDIHGVEAETKDEIICPVDGYEDVDITRQNNMCLCSYCRQELRSRGERLYIGFPTEGKCDWCGEEDAEVFGCVVES